MTIEEIRKNAPVGATHYGVNDDEVDYYAKDTIGRWCISDGCGSYWPLRTSTYGELDNTLKPL